MTATAIAVDQALDRLIDAGYDDAQVEVVDGHLCIDATVPYPLVWHVWAICGLTNWCWPCSSTAGPIDVDGPDWPPAPAGPCGHPVDPTATEETP